MPQVIAYYDPETGIVRDLDPYSSGDEILPKPGLSARIVADYAVEVGWKWNETAEGFEPAPEKPAPASETYEGLGAKQLIELAEARMTEDLAAAAQRFAEALALARRQL